MRFHPYGNGIEPATRPGTQAPCWFYLPERVRLLLRCAFSRTGPLSDGYKVLRLAHTHHLLEQALDSLGTVDGVGSPHHYFDKNYTLLTHCIRDSRPLSFGAWRTFRRFLDWHLANVQSGLQEKSLKLQQWIEASKGKLFACFPRSASRACQYLFRVYL